MVGGYRALTHREERTVRVFVWERACVSLSLDRSCKALRNPRQCPTAAIHERRSLFASIRCSSMQFFISPCHACTRSSASSNCCKENICEPFLRRYRLTTCIKVHVQRRL